MKEVLNNVLSGSEDRDAHGCFALKTTHGKHLVELKRELNKAVGYKGNTACNNQQANSIWRICTFIILWIQSRSFETIVMNFAHEKIMPCGQTKLQEFTVYFEGCHIDCDGNRKG